ncbi:hypothetical protein JW868_04335 [Candidatus Woesearchaeota archaeon]|nr:hypothetical protein [Candidatus Woesearchaeota archaeon]
MAVIGFNFTKMLAEKAKPTKGNISINNNLDLKSVEEVKMAVTENKAVLKLNFKFITTYQPDFGRIEFEGNVLFLDDKQKVKEVIDNWTKWIKEKKFGTMITEQMIPNILNKCNVQAIIMSKEINLPAPIPLPRPKVQK